ncbi:PhnD/SsuA/transferrin family substrate-binding protein, partial [Arthrospira platensis SPKY1]|nr:PhnD/SsuA/transferrin family substrate-binding protein [Arthrospira platensis SPKY1]
LAFEGTVSFAHSTPEDANRQTLTFGVFAYLGKEETEAQYLPIIEFLQEALPGVDVRLKVLSLDDLLAAIVLGKVDIATTNPTHFLVIRHAYPLSGVLATLVAMDPIGQPTHHLAGVVLVRAEDNRIKTFRD